MQRSTRQPDRVVTEKIDEQKTKIRIWRSDPDYQARLEVEREEKWQFGIGEGNAATLLSSTAETTDLVEDPEIPEWLDESLAGIGIREVESA